MYDENSNAAAAAALGATSTSSASSTGLMSQLLNVKDSRWLQLEVIFSLLQQSPARPLLSKQRSVAPRRTQPGNCATPFPCFLRPFVIPEMVQCI